MDLIEVIVISSAGKPIYYYGARHDSDVLTLCGLVTACIASTPKRLESDKDSSSSSECRAKNKHKKKEEEHLRYVRSGTNSVLCFLEKAPLVYVANCRCGEDMDLMLKAEIIDNLLLLLHDQILSTVTWKKIRSIFERDSSFDLRRLLAGDENRLTSLINCFKKSPSLVFQTVPVGSYTSPNNKSSSHYAQIQSAIKTTFKGQDIIFALIFSDKGNLLTLAERKEYSLKYRDAELLANLVRKSGFEQGGEIWIPNFCLPNSIDENAYVAVYIAAVEAGCCIVLVSSLYNLSDFHIVSDIRQNLTSKWKTLEYSHDADVHTEKNKRYLTGGLTKSLASIAITLNTKDAKFAQTITIGYYSDKGLPKVYRHTLALVRSQKADFLLYRDLRFTCCFSQKDDYEVWAVFDSLVSTEEIYASMDMLHSRIRTAHSQYFASVIKF